MGTICRDTVQLNGCTECREKRASGALLILSIENRNMTVNETTFMYTPDQVK